MALPRIEILVMIALLMTPLISISSKKVDVKVVASENIFEDAPFKQCHASTIVEAKDGLLAAWFGGTHEKHPDVCIYLASRRNGKWSAPTKVADGVINDTLRYACWNPVLFMTPNGQLLLFYKVGPNAREWWGMLKTSEDLGQTWSDAKRLPEGILGPIKNKPVLIDGYRLFCPSSTEDPERDNWQVHFEVTEDFGKTWEKIGPIGKEGTYNIIQPSILFHKGAQLQMLARSKENFVINSWSKDNGKTWSDPEPTSLPNPNSGTDAVTLKNGSHIIVYNNSSKTDGKWGGPRTPLNVAWSLDGINWKEIFTLENGSGEYSYPAVIQGEDGNIHITYTYKRNTIKYVCLEIVK